ncbi:helix-turn-helix transcriptional regulator [Mesorhizobium dulcispinae]|uniref:helix-turn-helix transcriptional regulator n=1 Tax=Mesorhizobium dulcispinae TaxID=3072316 RepID=UPI002A24EAE1|nr:helix-turn-helix domain-containing protein [Mesorhizobium sp. VK23D]MDX8518728.1 helix-turn-helix domain-containing protein [Mesorhizobium sp. VK23D]
MDTMFQVPGRYSAPGTTAERLLTLHQAAEALGLHYWQLQRAVKRGSIPAYVPFGRKLVRLSEVVAYVDSCRQGGVE